MSQSFNVLAFMAKKYIWEKPEGWSKRAIPIKNRVNNLFLSLLQVMIAFASPLFMKEAWLLFMNLSL